MARRWKRRQRSDDVQDREDRLSLLPDDILIHDILPLLPMREAVRTSIFSRRWRSLLRDVPSLDLDGSGQVPPYPRHTYHGTDAADLARFEESAYQAASKYADWVDHVIREYRGTTPLRCFRVLFHLDASFQERIDAWLTFSFQKGVQALQLQPRCSEYSYSSRARKQPYTFPVIQSPNIKLLKSLSLNDLVLTDDALEKLLSACDSLERLQLRSLDSLTAVRVTGPQSRLISIDVRDCREVRSVEIHSPTPHLVSFQFDGEITNVHIEGAPRLVHLGICTLTSRRLFSCISYISQAEALHLEVWLWERAIDRLPDLPDLSRLKHLRLELHSCRGSDGIPFGRQLQCLDSLISELPSLQHLTLEMQELDRKLKIGEEVPNLHLQLPRVIELVGFRGLEFECELALCLIKSAVSLEKLIIDCRRPALWGDKLGYPCSAGTRQKWRRTATKKITPELPPKAKLVFI